MIEFKQLMQPLPTEQADPVQDSLAEFFQINHKEKQMSSPNLLDAIRVVKENERMASESYANAANKVGDQMSKKVFEMLCEFEKVHYAQLTTLEKSLEESGDFTNYQGKEFPLPPKLEIETAKELDQVSTMGVINAAMDLEKRAEKVYADLAALVTDPQYHQVFSRLSEQEHNHYLLLRDAYWALSDQRTRLR
jgi:rubrerythrin